MIGSHHACSTPGNRIIEKNFNIKPRIIVVMHGRGKMFAVFLIIIIILALFVLIALWMMVTLNPGSQSGAVYTLFDEISQVALSIMGVLSGTMAWLIDRFWSMAG